MSTKPRARNCKCCGDRFIPYGMASMAACPACTNIALEIIRVCGPDYLSTKSVLYARNRERLRPISAKTPSRALTKKGTK